MSSEIIQLTFSSFTLLLPLPFPTVSQLEEDDNINITSQDFPGSQEQSPMFILQQHLTLQRLGQAASIGLGSCTRAGHRCLPHTQLFRLRRCPETELTSAFRARPCCHGN